MRIFVDVGAHLGESVDIALNPKFDFDRVFALEPATSCARQLRRFRDRRVEVCEYGLSNEDTNRDLFGAGLLGGSLFCDKQFIDSRSTSIVENVILRRASTWLATHSASTDEVFLKLNCEGSECDILDDIAGQADLCRRISSAYVDFDIRKVPRLAHRADETRDLLRSAGVEWIEPDARLSAQENVQSWLYNVLGTAHVGFGSRLYYASGLYRPPYVQARVIAKNVLPQRAYRVLGSRVGVHGSKLRRLGRRSGK